jgi:hypothetical protein
MPSRALPRNLLPSSTSVTSPRSREPAGTAVSPPTRTSRVTRASTRSSSLAVELETVFSICRPITEPESSTYSTNVGFGGSGGGSGRAGSASTGGGTRACSVSAGRSRHGPGSAGTVPDGRPGTDGRAVPFVALVDAGACCDAGAGRLVAAGVWLTRAGAEGAGAGRSARGRGLAAGALEAAGRDASTGADASGAAGAEGVADDEGVTAASVSVTGLGVAAWPVLAAGVAAGEADATTSAGAACVGPGLSAR